MQTNEFINEISLNLDKQLIFETDNELVPTNFHISEIKQSRIESIDCGGKEHMWYENIFHLFIPTSDDQYRPDMTSNKLLSIFGRVGKLREEADIKVEYSPNSTSPVSIYKIGNISKEQDKLFVHLVGYQSECKPLAKCE